MPSLLLPALFALGITGGFFSGLLGIGGGIIMVPLLLCMLPLLGFGALDMRTIAGMAMMQSLGGSLSALVVHRRNRFVHEPLVLLMGSSSVTRALIGSVWSKHLSSDTMLALFAGLALLASVTLFLPLSNSTETARHADIRFSHNRCHRTRRPSVLGRQEPLTEPPLSGIRRHTPGYDGP